MKRRNETRYKKVKLWAELYFSCSEDLDEFRNKKVRWAVLNSIENYEEARKKDSRKRKPFRHFYKFMETTRNNVHWVALRRR